jgi:hypothetical protein
MSNKYKKGDDLKQIFFWNQNSEIKIVNDLKNENLKWSEGKPVNQRYKIFLSI